MLDLMSKYNIHSGMLIRTVCCLTYLQSNLNKFTGRCITQETDLRPVINFMKEAVISYIKLLESLRICHTRE